MEMMSELDIKEPESKEENRLEMEETPQPDSETIGEETRTSGNKSFEQLVDEYAYELPKRGQILEGKVIRIDEDAILVDVGLKRDAVVPGREITQLDSELFDSLSPGSKVYVFVLRPPSGDQDLLVSINKGLEHQSWLKALQELENETILELPIVGFNKGGLLVKFENLRGFVPTSQVPNLRRIGDRERVQRKKQEMISESLLVKPVEVDQHRNRLVFSATAALDERRQRRLHELENGQVFLQAKVVSVVDFGVFIDLDGVDGLVHISQLDWTMVEKPSDLFKPGDEIDVKVINVDTERGRVSLSRKALLPSPWDTIDERYRTGDVLEGKVTRVLAFGAFVELERGLEGLVHVSELGYSSTGKPEEVVSEGDRVLVRILDIDKGRERLSLSMRRVPLNEQMVWINKEAKTPASSLPAEEPQPVPASEIIASQETNRETELEAGVAAINEPSPEDSEGEIGSEVENDIQIEAQTNEGKAEPDVDLDGDTLSTV